tara:strand:+ start:1973 stop:2626 length:654 start_codon:yes stop_codon:yes gene_type:complete
MKFKVGDIVGFSLVAPYNGYGEIISVLDNLSPPKYTVKLGDDSIAEVFEWWLCPTRVVPSATVNLATGPSVDLDTGIVGGVGEPGTGGAKVEKEYVDPKQAVGSSKLGFSHVPITALCLLSPGTKNGADKYGKWNWLELEDGNMSLTTYLDAIQRHLLLYRSGQEVASDSDINHLDHISAGIAVLRDAMVFDKVADDRIKLSKEQLEKLEALINNDI